jgi:hypothetical protein
MAAPTNLKTADAPKVKKSRKGMTRGDTEIAAYVQVLDSAGNVVPGGKVKVLGIEKDRRQATRIALGDAAPTFPEAQLVLIRIPTSGKPGASQGASEGDTQGTDQAAPAAA